MKPIQSACWALIASTFVLAAILVLQLSSLSPQKAKANMVIDRSNFSLMTAQTAHNQESLFVVDNSSGYLLIYEMNLPNRRMVPIGAVNLNNYFNNGSSGSNNQSNQTQQRQRR